MKTKSVLSLTRRYGPALFMLAVIPGLSLLPPRLFKPLAAAPQLPGADKLAHALLYAILTLTIFRALPAAVRGRWDAAFSITAAATLYGLIMELCQRYLTSSRSFDMLDATANAAGALVCSAIACSLCRRNIRNSTAP
ncbi:MAG: VanZ family protein [Kiritimatiellae bacterium]|nr:VanZ family protein [Kiritimatiellia bacterium]